MTQALTSNNEESSLNTKPDPTSLRVRSLGLSLRLEALVATRLLLLRAQ